MDMFPSTDSAKNVVDMFPRTGNFKLHSFCPLEPCGVRGVDNAKVKAGRVCKYSSRYEYRNA